jgi:hypothetical protein
MHEKNKKMCNTCRKKGKNIVMQARNVCWVPEKGKKYNHA